jgi:hypothetical protein
MATELHAEFAGSLPRAFQPDGMSLGTAAPSANRPAMAIELVLLRYGEWIVKVSARADRAIKEADRALERFVRDQRWDGFQLFDDTCTGPACPPGEP